MKTWKKRWCILLSALLCTITFGNPPTVSCAAKGDSGEGHGADTLNAQIKAASGKVNVYVEGTFEEEQAFQVLEQVNQARTAQGKTPLKMDKVLSEKAMQRAAECSVYYSHTRPNGKQCFSILESPYTMGCAENIAAGYRNADEVTKGWLDSPGHYANIMNADYKSIGIGCFYQDGVRYWAQLFSVYSGTEKNVGTNSVKKAVVETASDYLGSLSLSYQKQELQVGETAAPILKLTNEGFKYGYSLPSMDNVTFQTSDKAVAKVDTDGTLHANAKGTAVITAVLDDTLKAEYTVTVKQGTQSIPPASARPSMKPAESHLPSVSARPSDKPDSRNLSNPVIKESESMPSEKLVTWDCIYFGSYPQGEVTPGDSVYTKLERAARWDGNGDLIVDGVKYRRLLRDDKKTYQYFRYEPIKWRVLSTDGKQAFLLSDQILDNQLYHTENTMSVTWEKSTVRSWLNGYTASKNDAGADYSSGNFINSAFSAGEQKAIISGSVKNGNNLKYGTDGGNDTTDKVFLLSESEVYTEAAARYGFAADADVQDYARQAQSSDYARAMGNYDGFGGVGIWKLRSPGAQAYHSAYIYYGDVYPEGCFNDSNQEKHGIRAAVRFDLAFSGQYQDAGTVNSYGVTTAPVEPSEEPDKSDLPAVSARPSGEPEQSNLPKKSDSPAASKSPGIPTKGDVTGDARVTLADAQLVLKAALNLIKLDETLIKAADVDGNDRIELKDAQKILKVALNLDTFH